MSTPVIFLCFANEYHEGRYLDNLVQEYKNLYSVLAPISPEENTPESSNILCEIVVRQNVTIGDIVDVFQSKMYRGRIAIFHYGGHADGYQLLLEGKDGENKAAHGAGLVSLLSKQDNLKLVFLNGCSTQKMAQDLVARGVPAVIGTATSIADDVALNLSERFYKGLAQGLTLAGAWETAKDEVRTFMDSPSNYRSLYMAAIQVLPDRFPWDIEYRDDAAKEVFANWNLPDVARQPLFGLPPIAGKHQLPPSPFLFLKPYASQHAEIFFGRSYYIRDLYLKIAEPSSPPIILFYGESGAGKSSLLDAGLRPRLDAARNPENPDQLTYEVHYQRRNAETGLLGTLSEMLSYTLEAEEEAGEEIVEEDPNARTLEEIEGLINQLKGEERDTLRGFIERHKAVKSVQGKVQQKKNLYEGGELKAHTGAQLRAAWVNIEKMTGKRLILILDQVEETFARPHPNMPNELEDFLQIMKEIWATPDSEAEQAIQGRIILGYREEFNARIEARIKDFELSRTTVFLEHLQRKDILDIFAGLQSDVVRQHYNVQIEANLPERVADDLLKGRTSTGPGQAPVAPVLQLLLTKMWNKAYQKNSHEPYFTLDDYNAVQSQGREMEEFFYEQLGKVYEWDSDVVDTGLVLDILQYHVTDLGTSGRRHIDDMRSRYRHLPEVYEDRPDIIYNLVEKLKEVFLLVDNSRGFTSLPHDTLAPIVMREYNRSDKLGQRSTRILDTKLPDFELADDKKKSKVRLDDNDLEVVEGGVLGMRALSDTEYQLLEISKVEREKRLRLRRQLIQGGLVTGVIILLLALVVGSLSVNMVTQLRKAAVSHAHEESLELLSSTDDGLKPEEKKSRRIKLNSFAYQHDQIKRTDVIEDLYGLAHEYSLEEEYLEAESEDAPEAFSIRINSESRITSLDYRPSVGAIAAFADGKARFYPLKGKPSTKFSIETEDSVLKKSVVPDIRFSADGNLIQVAVYTPQPGTYDYGKMAVYNVQNTLQPAPLIPITIKHREPGYLYEGTEDQIDQDYLNYRDEEGNMLLGFYDCLSGSFRDFAGEQYRFNQKDDLYYKYIYYAFQNGFTQEELDIDSLFKIRLWDRPRQQITRESFDNFDERLQAIDLDEDNRQHLNSFYSNYFSDSDIASISCEGTKLEYTPSFDFQLLDLEGRQLISKNIDEGGQFFFRILNEDYLLTLEPDNESSNNAVLRSLNDLSVQSQIAHHNPILDIGITGDKKHFVTFSKDEAKAWTFDGSPAYEIQVPKMRHRLSPTDGSLIAFNKHRLEHWSAKSEKSSRTYSIADSTQMQIITVQFIPDDPLHLAIGIARTGDASKDTKDSVLYWNIADGSIKHAFTFDKEYQLRNAKVSAGGAQLAAWVKDKPDSKKSQEGAKDKLIFKARAGVGNLKGVGDVEPEKNERIIFSKGQRYVLLHHRGDDLVKVYNLSGEKVATYEFKKGFQIGFNETDVLTPDDAYMVGHSANSALLWTMKPQYLAKIESFMEIEEHQLSFSEKQEYNLHSIIDQIPGYDANNRNLSMVLLILALLFIVGRASNYLYLAFLKKDYQKAGLYGGIFILFAVLLLTMWSDTQYEESRLLLINFTLMACLVIAIPELIPLIRAGNFKKMIIPGMATLLFGGGLLFFSSREMKHDSVQTTDALMQALFMVIGFIVLLVGPTYLSLRGRRKNKMGAFYLWQLPVVFTVSTFVWILINFIFEESEIPFPDLILILLGLAGLIWMAIRQGKIYRTQGKRLPIWLYGILGLVLIIFTPSSFDIEAGIPANIIMIGTLALLMLGIETARQKAHRESFLILAAGTGLFTGILMNAGFGIDDYTRLYDSIEGLSYMSFMVLIPLIVYGIRYLLHRSERNQAKGSSPWIPRIAGIGLGASLLLLTFWISSNMEESYDEEDYAYEDAYYYDEEYEEDYYDIEEAALYDSIYIEEDAPITISTNPPSGDPGYPESVDSSSLDEEEYTDDELAEDADSEGEALSATPDPDLSSYNDRQIQVMGMFSPDESIRTQALNQLVSTFQYDPELLPELIGYNYENSGINEGIWNTLYLLERLPNEVLMSQQAIVAEYLDWAAQLGYGPSTMERIEGIQLRIQP